MVETEHWWADVVLLTLICERHCVQESADLDVLHMRLETLQKQVEDQQEHICVLRDTVSLKDRQADMLHSDVTRSLISDAHLYQCYLGSL